jgi:microcystin-dependent protein
MGTQFLSEIKMISFDFAPKGWAMCDGQILPIVQNQALYSLLGTTYGGDGRQSFALPDLRGRVPMHAAQGHVLGERGGEETHALNLTELPAHSHTIPATPNAGDADKPQSVTPANSAPNHVYTSMLNPSSGVSMNPAMVSTVGGSQPHENRQPYLVIGFAIALEGAYPSRT